MLSSKQPKTILDVGAKRIYNKTIYLILFKISGKLKEYLIKNSIQAIKMAKLLKSVPSLGNHADILAVAMDAQSTTKCLSSEDDAEREKIELFAYVDSLMEIIDLIEGRGAPESLRTLYNEAKSELLRCWCIIRSTKK